MTSRRYTMSNQRWNNVVYVNVEIHNVQPRWSNVVYFNVELNNVGQRRNNVVNMTIWKKKSASIQKRDNIFELKGFLRNRSLLRFENFFIDNYRRNLSKNLEKYL